MMRRMRFDDKKSIKLIVNMMHNDLVDVFHTNWAAMNMVTGPNW